MAISFKKPSTAPTPAVLPKVRERQEVVDALSEAARAAGITDSEAVRQLLEGYLREPFTLAPATTGALDGILAPCRANKPLVVGIQRHAKKAGVSVSEIIRQVVRRQVGNEMNEGGRL